MTPMSARRRKRMFVMMSGVAVGTVAVAHVLARRGRQMGAPPRPTRLPRTSRWRHIGSAAPSGLGHAGPSRPDSDALDPREWRQMTLAMLALPVLLLVIVGSTLAMRGGRDYPIPPQFRVPGGDIERGRQAIIAHGCGACHVIPQIRDATGRVGPQLHGLREQIYIAGRLPNVPENLAAWIQNPQHFDPLNAMPNLGVTEPEARDIAAYLYSVP